MSFDLRLFNGDIKVTNGVLEKVSGTEKLVQDLVRAFLTPKGSSKFYPEIGTLVGDVIGRNYPDDVTMVKIEDSFKDALRFLINKQEKQLVVQNLDSGERILQILSVRAERPSSDPRQINDFVAIVTDSGDVIERSFKIAQDASVFVAKSNSSTFSTEGGFV